MLKAGILGCGYWGSLLTKKIRERKDYILVGCADPIEASRNKIQQLVSEAKILSDFKELIPECEAVVIATPITTHFELAKYCLSAGKHVLVEKPLAMSVPQCDELIQIAKEKRLTLMVDHTFLYVPAIRDLRNLLNAPEFGSCNYIDIVQTDFGGFCSDVNVLWDIAPHTLAFLVTQFGLPTKIEANLPEPSYGVPAHSGYLSLKFPNNTCANLRFSWNGWERKREWLFVSDKQMIRYDDLQPADKKIAVRNRSVGFKDRAFTYSDGEVVTPTLQVPAQDPLSFMLEDFSQSVQTGKSPVSNAETGRVVVQVLQEATK